MRLLYGIIENGHYMATYVETVQEINLLVNKYPKHLILVFKNEEAVWNFCRENAYDFVLFDHLEDLIN